MLKLRSRALRTTNLVAFIYSYTEKETYINVSNIIPLAFSPLLSQSPGNMNSSSLLNISLPCNIKSSRKLDNDQFLTTHRTTRVASPSKGLPRPRGRSSWNLWRRVRGRRFSSPLKSRWQAHPLCSQNIFSHLSVFFVLFNLKFWTC